MKFWIAKKSGVPVREQLETQVLLGIASGELGVGAKLPSTNEVARRCRVHANTVAGAYQQLVGEGWLEFRKGSGYFVRERSNHNDELDQIVAQMLRSAIGLGYSAADVEARIRKFVDRPRGPRVVLLEDDSDYRAILQVEIEDALGREIESYATSGYAPVGDEFLTAMFDERPKIEPDTACLFLNNRSVAAAMSVHSRPSEDDLIAVLSAWDKFLLLAHTMLIAARIDGESLIVRSTREADWRKGLDAATIIICDAPTALHFESDPRLRTFRLIADESLENLRSELR